MKFAQSCPTLCNPTDYTVHEILQVRILEWVALPFSRGSSKPRNLTQISCIAGRFFASWATGEAQEWVACLYLLQWIFPTQDRARVSCIAGGFFTNWAMCIPQRNSHSLNHPFIVRGLNQPPWHQQAFFTGREPQPEHLVANCGSNYVSHLNQVKFTLLQESLRT